MHGGPDHFKWPVTEGCPRMRMFMSAKKINFSESRLGKEVPLYVLISPLGGGKMKKE